MNVRAGVGGSWGGGWAQNMKFVNVSDIARTSDPSATRMDQSAKNGQKSPLTTENSL